MDICTLAPVAIPTLNRYEHLRRCVESLSRCKYAKETELIIGLDRPPSEKYIPGYNKIKEYVKTIDGFKKITVLVRDSNYGAQKNWRELIKYAYKEYDSVIMTEDDNEFSPLFLEYQNQGLSKYKEDPRITAICGYNPPIDMSDYPYNNYASYGYNAWGIGLWREKNIDFEVDVIKQQLRRPTQLIKVYKRSPDLVYALIVMLKDRNIWEDTCAPFYNILNDSFSVFPKTSFVRNWGFDGSGLHCAALSDSVYLNQEIFHGEAFSFDNIEIKETEYSEVKQYIRRSYTWKRRIRLFFSIIKFYLS